MKTSSLLPLLALAAAPVAAQEMPPELVALTATARLNGTVSMWCRAEFRAGHPGGFAVAVTSPNGGRYVALDSGGTVTDLGTFKQSGGLSCYRRVDAEKLDTAIRQSETIHGQISPRWDSTVVCGFIEDTVAECWQYSPVDRAFATVGRWVT